MPKNNLTQKQLLTQKQITDAALNKPFDEFVLGDRTFKIHQLPYDDYNEFFQYLSPILEGVFKKFLMSSSGELQIPGMKVESQGFSAFDLLSVCKDNLPELALITCRQSDPDITIEEVKRLAGRPLPLAQLVLKQVVVNKMIEDFKDFFGQMISMMKALK